MIPPSPSDFPAIETPVPHIDVWGSFDALVHYAPIKALLPLPVLALIAPLIWLVFRKTWQQLDEEARQDALARDPEEADTRPYVCLLLVAVTLTLHEYYGGRSFFGVALEPVLRSLEENGFTWLKVTQFHELYGYAWWVGARIFGYVVVPLLMWRIFYPQHSVLDMGLRTKGFFSHLWLYALCLACVFAAMAILSKQEDFLAYYPFYKASSRSWLDYLAWEAMYFAQFLALEFYFRGWMLEVLRKRMGAASIFVMAVPYCMVHYGKPYLEAHGAIIAGVVLGSLAMRTRSIYAGFLVHITVAGLMDYYALVARDGLPKQLFPG